MGNQYDMRNPTPDGVVKLVARNAHEFELEAQCIQEIGRLFTDDYTMALELRIFRNRGGKNENKKDGK